MFGSRYNFRRPLVASVTALMIVSCSGGGGGFLPDSRSYGTDSASYGADSAVCRYWKSSRRL